MARYQRGGLVGADGAVQPPERWTYASIPRMVARVRELEGKPELPYYLIGHSAGGQFLVRMAAFLPGEAERIIAANAAQALAKEKGWVCNWRLVETPGIAHEAAFMFAAKEAGDAIFGK
jgi:pimeloyl-ACP methyl ester carboxylesterase